MTAARKVKISVSLDADLVDDVDRLAAREQTTRSAVMERWLRQATHRARVARLEEETAAYYQSLTPAEQEDDAAWAAGSAQAARRLTVDHGAGPRDVRKPGRTRRMARRG